MTVKSWMAQYYPVPAVEVRSEKEAVIHSLVKWTGLRPENLAEHKLRHAFGNFRDNFGHNFLVNGGTCALCRLVEDVCEECPITRVTGASCEGYAYTEEEPGSDAYNEFVIADDPEPMIALLKETLEGLK